ncbi:TonB-dependent receptor [Burkholderiales bacterium]|nr:TonB-dependent receptor [Burkholderiales bacterium]
MNPLPSAVTVHRKRGKQGFDAGKPIHSRALRQEDMKRVASLRRYELRHWGRLLLALAAWLVATAPVLADDQQAAPQELPEVTVIGSSPVSGTGIPINLYPGNVQTISSRNTSAGTSTVSDALNAAVGSVNVNDTQGNPFQMDLDYRGYTASPVLGTPQGLSVYVDGMRVNEPFGDVVSWDLIPQIAVANVTVIPGTNPVYGLNTLGGALAINTKSGFAYPGASVSLGTGSFERRTVDAEYGGHQENTDFYVAGSFFDDHGWAKFNPSVVRQFFAKLGFQDAKTDLDFSVQCVNDYLAGNQLVPHSMIEDATQGYSHPDYASTRNLVANLTGKRQWDAANSLEGNVYFRDIHRQMFNSNINDPVVAGSPDQVAVCTSLYGEPCAGNIETGYSQDVYGLKLQYSNQGTLLGTRQYFSAGLDSEYATVDFSQASQYAMVDANAATLGIGAFTPQSNIESHNTTTGVYATDTLVLDPRWSLTLSARYDNSAIDLSGTSVDIFGDRVAVSGDHSYQRLNPAIGGTFALTPGATLFANYAQGFRTPSAIELACADPAHPCAGVPSAFSSDPGLKGVLAKSIEVGGRGQFGAGFGWRIAGFHSDLANDILFNQSTLTTGYFSNVGKTRREGVEMALDGKLAPFDFVIATTLLNATYQSSFDVADTANAGSTCPGSACVPVQPGDRIPGIPQLIAKFKLGYQLTSKVRLDTLVQAQGSSYARGDENNLATFGTIPGFCTVKLGFTQRINDTFEINAGVSNLFNRLYANFGMLSNNDLRGGIAENFWAVGQPRTFFLGLRAFL